MANFTPIVVYFLSFFLLAFGQKYDFGAFINPPDQLPANTDASKNAVYPVGSSLNITWATNASLVDLVIWQSTSNNLSTEISALQYLPDSKAITTTGFNWTIGLNGLDGEPSCDLTKGNIFHLDLYSNGAVRQMATGMWFNVTNSTVDAHGSIISTATPSPTSSPTSSSTSRTVPTTTSSNSPSPTAPLSSGGLSTSGKIGLGVGVGLGVSILLALIAAIFYMRQRINAQPNMTASAQNVSEKEEFGDRSRYTRSPPSGGLYELPPSEPSPSELPPGTI